MLAAQTSDGKYAFDLERWSDIAEDVAEDLGIPATAYDGQAGVLVVWKSTEGSHGAAWQFEQIITADNLRDALAEILASTDVHEADTRWQEGVEQA